MFVYCANLRYRCMAYQSPSTVILINLRIGFESFTTCDVCFAQLYHALLSMGYL